MSLSRGTRSWGGSAVAALVMLGGLGAVLVGCGADAEPVDQPTRAAAPAPADSRSVFEVGDCFDNAPVAGATPTPVIDCAGLHDNEVYDVVVVEGDAYPGSGELRRMAQDACAEAFATDLEDAGFVFFAIPPSELMWERDGDRAVVCALYHDSGPMEGGALPGA